MDRYQYNLVLQIELLVEVFMLVEVKAGFRFRKYDLEIDATVNMF